MQEGKILDIYVKENNVTVVWHLPQEEPTQEKQIALTQPQSNKKSSAITEFINATIKQVFSLPPSTTRVVFTKAAIAKMGVWGLSEHSVQDAVLHGEAVRGKDNMISRKYNGYEIGVIAKYNKATNTYLVLSAWKRDRR
jgi:hypothetical protein